MIVESKGAVRPNKRRNPELYKCDCSRDGYIYSNGVVCKECYRIENLTACDPIQGRLLRNGARGMA